MADMRMTNTEVIIKIKDRMSTHSWVAGLIEAGLIPDSKDIHSVKIDLHFFEIPVLTVEYYPLVPQSATAPMDQPLPAPWTPADDLKAAGATPDAQAAIVREGGGRYA
jgi:hypothetical protein